MGEGSSPVLEPQCVSSLPPIRTLRFGGSHAMACSAAGDVFSWGRGRAHQLGNCPRDDFNPEAMDKEPIDELYPYCLSSNQLQSRFVLLADGGDQHSVELAWSGRTARRSHCWRPE